MKAAARSMLGMLAFGGLVWVCARALRQAPRDGASRRAGEREALQTWEGEGGGVPLGAKAPPPYPEPSTSGTGGGSALH